MMGLRRHSHRPAARVLCQRCGRRIPPVARKHRDPFCSRVCAEATYGTPSRRTTGRIVVGGVTVRTP